MVVAQDLVVGRLTYPPQAGSGAFFFFFHFFLELGNEGGGRRVAAAAKEGISRVRMRGTGVDEPQGAMRHRWQ